MKRWAWLVLVLGTYLAATVQAAEIDDNINALKDPDAAIRAKALESLVMTGKAALPPLKDALTKADAQKDAQAESMILQALAGIHPDPEDKDLRILILKILKNRPELRADATKALGSFGKASAETFRNLLKDKDPEIRRQAILGFGYLGPDAKDYVKTLTGYLSPMKYTTPFRSAAAEALGRIGADASGASKDLWRNSRDKDAEVRVAVVIAMCRIGPEEKDTASAVEALITEDASWNPAKPKVIALGRDNLPFFAAALQSSVETVKYKALVAMAAIPPPDYLPETAALVAPLLKEGVQLGTRRAAMNLFTRMNPDALTAAIPQLAALLKDKDGQIRNQAAATFNRLSVQGKGSTAKLAAILKDKDPVVRAQVLGILVKMGVNAAPAAPALLELFKDDNAQQGDVVKLLDTFGRPALQAYLDALKSDSPVVKQVAIEQIGKLGPAAREAAAALGITLRDGDKVVRAASAEALEKIGKGVIPALREQLKDKDPVLRAQTIETLGEMGPKGKIALVEIRAALADATPAVRIQAALALRKLGEIKAASPDVIRLLGDPDRGVRKAAVAVLEDAGPAAQTAVPALAALLHDRDKELRLQAIMTLKSIGAPARPAVPALVHALIDMDPEVRIAAIQTLGKIGPDAYPAVPVLIVLFTEKDETLRGLAATAIGDVGPTAIPLLVEALKYEDKDVRQYAAMALVNMGPKAKPALPALGAALTDKEVEVRKNVALSLKELGPDTLPILPSLLAAEKDPDADVRSNVILTLASFPPTAPQALAAVVRALKDKEDGVQLVAVESLRKLGPARTLPALIVALKDKDKNSRIRASEVLEKFGPQSKEAEAALIEAARDMDDAVRVAATKALEKLGK